MKYSRCKNVFTILMLCVYGCSAFTQISQQGLQQFISDEKQMNNAGIRHVAGISLFYSSLPAVTAWIQKENVTARAVFFNELKCAPVLGLTEKDYQFNYIESIRNGKLHLQNNTDSIEAELRIADAAIHFYSDIAYGNTKPLLGYNGLGYTPGCYAVPVLLAEYISNNRLPLLTAKLSSSFTEVAAIGNKIQWFQHVLSEDNFTEVSIVSKQVNNNNKELITKLYQLGVIDSINKNFADSFLKQRVKEVQKQFDLLADGVLRSTCIQELNVPLYIRLQQLTIAINYYRWLFCLAQDKPVIVVNIPAAYLKVYHGNNVLLAMRMIVGKKATTTPTLASTVTEVVLYPYWHVPYRIATRELLPAIKRNPGYIDAGNYQVLSRAGKIINPYSINWQELSTSYFPYIIRQSTGCDNSLGLLKLNFYNPWGVYLHDTPVKGLFVFNKRFFSHGCMRMEKPMELGHLVLKNNQIAIDTLEQKGCVQNQKPITVSADEKMPVVVWYNPVGTDSTGRVIFFEDVYGKFDWMKRTKK